MTEKPREVPPGANPLPPVAKAPPSGPPSPPPELTPEEQMERFAQELKETDWGHQPC